MPMHTCFCDYWKRSGHTKNGCYKLYVYTSNSIFIKGQGSTSAKEMLTHLKKETIMVRRKILSWGDKCHWIYLNVCMRSFSTSLGNFRVEIKTMKLSGAMNLTCILACYFSMTEIGNWSCIDCWILDHRIKSITPYDLWWNCPKTTTIYILF